MLEVSTWEIVWTVHIFKAFFIYLFVYYFVLDRSQFALMKLYNIRVLLNRANCWNFQTEKRNLDTAVSASSNRLFFYDLLITIFVRDKADHHYSRSTFLKKSLFSYIFISKPEFLTKLRLVTVSRFSIFLGWSQYRSLGKRFSKVSYKC